MRVIQWTLLIVVILSLEIGRRTGRIDVLTWVPLNESLGSLIEGFRSGDLWTHVAGSVLTMVVAFIAAVTFGVPIGYVLWRVQGLYKYVELYLESYFALPIFVLYPVLVLFLGMNIWSMAIIVWLWAVAGVIVNTNIGLRRVPSGILKYSMSLGLNERQKTLQILLPSALPSIITGIKLAAVYSIAGTIGVEFILSSRGIGRLINDSYNSFETARMYALIILVLVIAYAANFGLRRAEDSLAERRGQVVDHLSAAASAGRASKADRETAGIGWTGMLIVPVTVLALWYALSAFSSDAFLVPPHVAFESLWEGFMDGSVTSAIKSTIRNTLFAFVFSTLAGVTVGYLLGSSRFLADIFEGAILALYATPKVVLYPVVLFVFGFSDTARVVLGVLHGLPVVMIFCIAAVRSVSRAHIKVARSLGMRRVATFRHITLPSALPEVLSGLRFGLSLCFLGVLVAEMLVGRSIGVGSEILDSSIRGDTARMFALVTLVSVLAISANRAMAAVERVGRAAEGRRSDQ